jgi:DNA-binding transcriptional MocR family regulator
MLGLSQMLVYKILSKWGYDGFKEHIVKVQQFYRERRDFAVNSAIKHLTGTSFALSVSLSLPLISFSLLCQVYE